MLKICNFVIKYSIYLLVFLLPLFWLPLTSEVYEFNKQYLLFVLVGLGLLAWLFKMVVVKKRLTLVRTPLDIPILVFMLAMILSTVFSVDRVSSLLGFYGRFSDNLVGILGLCLFYFLVVNNVGVLTRVRTPSRLSSGLQSVATPSRLSSGLLNIFLASAGVAVVAAYFSIFGLWAKIPWLSEHLPRVMGLRTFNPVSGSLEGLAVFLAAVVCLVVGMILVYSLSERPSQLLPLAKVGRGASREVLDESDRGSRLGRQRRLRSNIIKRAFYALLLLVSVVLLLIIDFWAAWVVLGVVMLILLIFAFWSRIFSARVNILLIPIILVLISAAGLLVTGVPTKVGDVLTFVRTPLSNIPREVILDYRTAGQVSWGAIKKYSPVGSGLGTFAHDFSLFLPSEFNQNRFWNIRFDKAPAHLLEMVATTGVLGLLGYLAVVGLFGLVMVLFLRKFFIRQDPSTWSPAATSLREELLPERSEAESKAISILPLLLTWLALFIAQFVYLQNTTLAFCFWLMTGLAVVEWRRLIIKGSSASPGQPLMKFSFAKWPEVGLVMSTLLIMVALALLVVFFFGVRFYWAEAQMRQQQGMSSQQLIKNLEKVVNLNPYRARYRITLSQAYLVGAIFEARKPAKEQDSQVLQSYVSKGIEQARQATQMSPNLVFTWENLGIIYRDLRILAAGAETWAIDTFRKASELEPQNPVFYAEIGKIYLAGVTSPADEEKLGQAIEQFQKAVALKSDYLDPQIQMALAEEKKGNIEEAIKKLEGLLIGQPLVNQAQIEALFQLGRLYFNSGRLDQAINAFQLVIRFVPNHSNAHYALAVAYLQQGMREQALKEFEIVLALNPGNEDIRRRIEELRR